jgi:hypothetical protein
VSRGATESDFVMGCPRCHNLMVEETFVDWETSPSVSSFTGWRCLICGEILDPIILQNRTRHPEPQDGRARLNTGGIMVARGDWEPPHPGFESGRSQAGGKP